MPRSLGLASPERRLNPPPSKLHLHYGPIVVPYTQELRPAKSKLLVEEFDHSKNSSIGNPWQRVILLDATACDPDI